MKPITKAGYEKQKERLATMKDEFSKLPAIISEAREKGDLKENAEYHAARERQGLLQAQISKLESDIAQSQVLDPATLNPNLVTFGKVVTLKDHDNSEELEYRIVGEMEAVTENNEIAVTTPIAKGLLGKKKGDTVTITVPAGTRKLEVVDITV